MNPDRHEAAINWTGERQFSLDPQSPAFYNDPYTIYRQLHQHGGPVFWEQYNMWCLTGFEQVNQCLRDKSFARLPPVGFERKPYASHLNSFATAEKYSLLALEPPQHTRLRKLVNRAFVSRQVEAMSDEIKALTDNCIDTFAADGHAELLSQFATPIPVTVIARLLGIPESDTTLLLDWSHAMVKVYTMTQSHADEVAANHASKMFMAYLHEQIKIRRENLRDDLLSHMIRQQQVNDGATDGEIVSVAILLLNAGHEATVHQLGNSIVNIIRHPPADPNWYEDSTTIAKVVTECLRHDAPLHLFTRFAQVPVQLSVDVKINAGTEVALLLGAANHCPMQFSMPELFDPERTDNQHVSLGAGLHFCVGAPLAKLELQIALSSLFTRLENLRLKEPPTYRNSYHFHGLEALNVTWDI